MTVRSYTHCEPAAASQSRHFAIEMAELGARRKRRAKRPTAFLTKAVVPNPVCPGLLSVLAMPFEPVGAGVPFGGALQRKVAGRLECPDGMSFQGMPPLMLAGINTDEVVDAIVKRVAVAVMNVAALRHSAVMALPNGAIGF